MPRVISIDRHRLTRWLDNFAARHGDLQLTGYDAHGEPAGPTTPVHRVRWRAADGAEAASVVPFGPVPPPDHRDGDDGDDGDLLHRLTEHLAADRRVGAVLVRRGGFAVGVFDGDSLINSRNGSGYVQGRTKAGGWSQQRYARRRANQAQQLYDKASAAAEEVLLPVLDQLAGVAGGGDRAGVIAALGTPRLRPVRELLMPTIHPTDDPRKRVLEAFPRQFLAVELELNELA